jgi:hypothetical protein
MQLGIHALDESNLEIEPSLESNGLTLTLRGSCDAFAVTPLGSYLKRVFAEIERLDCANVTFDIRGLCLVNSSCLKQFITFLHELPSLRTGSAHKVDFLVDAKLGWQARALAAFVRMWPEIVSVIRVGENDTADHAGDP